MGSFIRRNGGGGGGVKIEQEGAARGENEQCHVMPVTHVTPADSCARPGTSFNRLHRACDVSQGKHIVRPPGVHSTVSTGRLMAGPQVFNFTSFTETYNRTGQTRQHVATQKKEKEKKVAVISGCGSWLLRSRNTP